MKQQPLPDTVWYYTLEGETFGPFTQTEMLQKAAEGIVTPETFVIVPGESEWRPFASVDAFKAKELPVQESKAGEGQPAKAGFVMPRSVQDSVVKATSADVAPSGESGEQRAITMKKEGCKNGCFGCLGLFVIVMLFGGIFNTCSKQSLTLSDEERSNPAEAVQKLMKAVYGDSLRETEANGTYEGSEAGGKLIVRVRVNVEKSYSNSSTISSMEYDMEKAFKALYESGLPIWEVVIWNHSTMIDRYGNKSDGLVYKVGLQGSEAAKVDWSNVSLRRVWEVKFIHPSLAR